MPKFFTLQSTGDLFPTTILPIVDYMSLGSSSKSSMINLRRSAAAACERVVRFLSCAHGRCQSTAAAAAAARVGGGGCGPDPAPPAFIAT